MKNIPVDLNKKINNSKKAKEQWNGITENAQRDFVIWISTAKQKETRERRIKRAVEMLEEGKKRPCCFSIVPMDFYKSLGKNPKAKSKWGKLSPTEKRDLIVWIETAKSSDERDKRMREFVQKVL